MTGSASSRPFARRRALSCRQRHRSAQVRKNKNQTTPAAIQLRDAIDKALSIGAPVQNPEGKANWCRDDVVARAVEKTPPGHAPNRSDRADGKGILSYSTPRIEVPPNSAIDQPEADLSLSPAPSFEPCLQPTGPATVNAIGRFPPRLP
jgi:hypothetical protein